MQSLTITQIGLNSPTAMAPVGLPELGAALDRLAPPAPTLAQMAAGQSLALESLTLQLMQMIVGLMMGGQSQGSTPVQSGGVGPLQPIQQSQQSQPQPLQQSQSQNQPSSADAGFINDYLRKKGSKAADQQFGELAVKYGREFEVDPLVLLAIAGHETGFGKLGVGLNGLLGVGAYDSDPNNSTRNSKFSGVENQLRVGAKTFANLRKKGGASPSDSIEKQLEAVNRAGWATDPKWHQGVAAMYKQIKGAR